MPTSVPEHVVAGLLADNAKVLNVTEQTLKKS